MRPAPARPAGQHGFATMSAAEFRAARKLVEDVPPRAVPGLEPPTGQGSIELDSARAVYGAPTPPAKPMQPEAAMQSLNEALLEDVSDSCVRYDCIVTCFDHAELPQRISQLNCDFVGYLIWQDQVCLEMEQSDPLADYPLIPLSLLQTLPMVMYASDGQEKTFTELVFQKRGVTLQVVYRIPSENGKRFAQHHHAYSVIGSPTNELRPHPGHILVPIEGNIRSNQCLLIPRAKVTQFPLPDLLRIFDDLFSVKKLF